MGLHLDHQPDANANGSALISVIGLVGILSIVVVVSLTYVLNAQPQARQHQDWNAALAAADAGLDDYLARLNRDRFYFQNTTATDPTSANYNPALDPDAWATLPGGDAFYTYEVDSSEVASQGTIKLTVTGRVNRSTRTIEAWLRPETFLDYIYLTDSESRDGTTLYFISIDDVRGPLRTNDTLHMSGTPRFRGTVQTNWPGVGGTPDNPSPPLYRTLGTTNPVFDSGPPQWAPRIVLPPGNEELSLNATEAAGGCLYWGPTYIRLDGNRMRVHSPRSNSPPPGQDAPPSRCLAANSLTWLDLPPNGVIYVANHTQPAGGAHPLGLGAGYSNDAGHAFVWGELDGRLTIGGQSDISIIWDVAYADADENLIGLIAGDNVRVFHPVSGGANDRVTQATGVARPPFPHGSDMPVPRNAAGTFEDPVIDGAILALRGSFTVDNFTTGTPLGELSITGSISQQARGAVGQFNSGTGSITRGYGKNYVYDERLRYLSPPYFIDPVQSQYRVTLYAEVQTPAVPPSP